MSNLTLKQSGDQFWDRISVLVGNEIGNITGSPFTDGIQFYNAVFTNYGEVTWIPASACTITETPDQPNP